MSLEVSEYLFVRDNRKTGGEELVPGRILWTDAALVAAQFEAARINSESESDVLMFFHLNGTFVQQAASISGVTELTPVNVASEGESEKMDVRSASEKVIVALERRGEPVSAENRECFRLRNPSLDIDVNINGDANCALTDISQTGMAVICGTRYERGTILETYVHYEGLTVEGPARIQSVKELRTGRFRYGLLGIERSMQRNCASLAMAVQRKQLRRLAGRA